MSANIVRGRRTAAALVIALAVSATGFEAPNLDTDPAFDEYRQIERMGGFGQSVHQNPLEMPAILQPGASAREAAPSATGWTATAPTSVPAASGPAPARIAVSQPTPSLAIVDLDSETVSTPELRAVGQALETEFARLGKFALEPQEKTRKELVSVGLLPYDPYKAPPPNAQLAGALGAEYLLRGTLNKVGDLFSLNTEIYDARRDTVARSDSRVAQGGLGDLLTQAGAIVTALTQGLSDCATGPAAPLEPVYGSSASAPAGVSIASPPRAEAASGPLADARDQIAELSTEVKKLRTDLDKQNALAAQYKDETDRLRRDLSTTKERVRETVASKPEGTKPADQAKAAELAEAAKQPGLSQEEKIAKLAEAVRLDPQTPDRHLDLAKAHYAARDYDKAEQACAAGIQLHPRNAALRTVLGVTYYAREDYVRAEKAYREALSISPSDSFAQYNLALTISKTVKDHSRDGEAMAEWERYLKIALNDPSQAYWVEQAKAEISALQAETKKPETASGPAK
ncbi:MAG: tetratricopeptide repeat protein [Candidatus Sumerlaeota bacterium]|nr:tetratricopeptide repeat protein [Candidatus Sumerlaeota bacterium]